MNTGVIYSEHTLFYVISLIKENFFVLALLILPFIKLSKETKLIAMPTLLTFLTYSLFSHKEMRLLLVVFPLITILAAHSAITLYNLFSKWNKELSKSFAISLIAFWFVLLFMGIINFVGPSNPANSQEEMFQVYMQKHQDKEFWTSNPKYALHSDAKVSGLMYYPLVFGTPDVALVNSCDFLGNNEAYTAKTAKHIAIVENTMENTYTATENGCTYRIFERTTS
jgi:hypothetical protein